MFSNNSNTQPLQVLHTNYVVHNSFKQHELIIETIKLNGLTGIDELNINTDPLTKKFHYSFDKANNILHVWQYGDYGFNCYLVVVPQK